MFGEMCEQINEWITNDSIVVKNSLIHTYSLGEPLSTDKIMSSCNMRGKREWGSLSMLKLSTKNKTGISQLKSSQKLKKRKTFGEFIIFSPRWCQILLDNTIRICILPLGMCKWAILPIGNANLLHLYFISFIWKDWEQIQFSTFFLKIQCLAYIW